MVDIINLNPIGSYKVDFCCTFLFWGPFLPQNFSNGCICRKSTSQNTIGSFKHFAMGLTTSQRLWETIHLSWVFPLSLAYTEYSMWTLFIHTFHHCWKHRRYQINWNLPSSIQTTFLIWNYWSHHAHIGQGYSQTKYPTLSGGQSRVGIPPRQMAHQESSSTKVSPSDGGTQLNGYHFLLRGEDWSR